MTNLQRLDGALKFLVGRKKSRAILDQRDQCAITYMLAPRYEDERALWLYKEKRTRKEPVMTAAPKIRSDGELAEEAAGKFLSHETQSTAANRLREKLSGAYYRKQGKYFDCSSPAAYEAMLHYDYLEAARKPARALNGSSLHTACT